jgi:hypothetical protein
MNDHDAHIKAARELFAENQETIKHLIGEQLDIIEELEEYGQDAPQLF